MRWILFAAAIGFETPPLKGHPIFKAMHGLTMCCRGCMEKWWHVKRGVPLTDAQKAKAVDFLMAWVLKRMLVRIANNSIKELPQ